MDDNSKQASSFQLDQEILDARGINMTVAEVAGLSKLRYSERVHSLNLSDSDCAFLKGLRRRIKNRLASQNSRRRSMEHLRRLARELRAVRECKGDAASERQTLTQQRIALANSCRTLYQYLEKVLQDREDTTPIPVNLDQIEPITESQPKKSKTKTHIVPIDLDTNTFECRVSNLVSQSINHIYKPLEEPLEQKKIICAKTVFLNGLTDITPPSLEGDFKDGFTEDCGVLNLSVKNENGRRHHGRKQTAPRRIVCSFSDYDDSVLDLKIKKEK